MTSQTHESPPTPEDSRYEAFIARFARHEPDLRRFIRSLLPTTAVADEVLQQTDVATWRKFDQHDPGTNFMKWACVIARFEVPGGYRRKLARDRLAFDADLMELMADEGVEEMDTRRAGHTPSTEIVDLGAEFGLGHDAVSRKLVRNRLKLQPLT